MNRSLLGGEGHPGGVIPFWRAVFEIARKDVLIFARTKRLFIFGGIFAVGLLGVTIFWASLYDDFFGEVGAVFGDLAGANIVLALALGFPVIGAFFWLNALGIIFAFDAVVREHEDKSLFLILSKPVAREAFVLGKYLGAAFSVGAIFLVLSTSAYFLAQLITGDAASPGDVGRFYGGIGLITLGMFALSAMALFFSAVTRSTVASVVLSLLSWIVVLNLLSNIGIIVAGIRREVNPDDWWVQALQYFNPGTSVGPALEVMLNLGAIGTEARGAEITSLFGGIGLDPSLSFLALLTFSAVFVGATMLVVNKRNFE